MRYYSTEYFECIEKSPAFYTMFPTAEQWFDYAQSLIEYPVFLFTFRVCEVKKIPNTKSWFLKDHEASLMF